MARRQRRSHRSGVVLLVILSLLVLFALLGVTFVIVSGQYKRSASAFARTETYGDDWARQLDTAMYTSVRDTHDSASPLRGHSLLLDLYGHDTYAGRVTAASVTSGFGGGQLIDVQCTLSYVPDNTQPVPQEAGFFNGCVLTFSRPLSATTTSQLAGNSVRIIGSAYDTTNSTYTLRIMRPTPDNSSVSTVPLQGDLFIINGRPFAGSGAGYDATTGKLDMSLVTQPNRVGQNLNSYLLHGANENWDAADLQNLFLAAVIPDESHATGIRHYKLDNGTRVFTNLMPGDTTYPSIIPSFHRPTLIQYTGGAPTATNSFRPTSLPALADPINGPWDVDNDGDGIADSIWIDLNFPVQTTPGGLRYKPLFAFHIVDMDGRLNLNFQGNQQHYAPEPVMAGRWLADGMTTTADWPVKGHGAGPAEVVLGNADTTNPVGLFGFTNYQQLLQTRWGNDGLPGDGSAIALDSINSTDISATKFFEIPGNYSPDGNSAYASPPDLRGQLAVGVDRRGQLIMDRSTDTDPTTDFRREAAYRTWMSKDRRFTPTELERILRYYDIDAAQLPTRLETVAGVLATSTGLTAAERQMVAVNRRIVTTESYDMPVATATNTANTGRDNRRDPMALLRERTRTAMLSETELLKLVDRDFYFGLKMNINRPLGDAKDSNGNGVIDEPLPNEIAGPYNSGNDFQYANGLDLDGDGMKDPQAELLVRHQLAKHLYVLASLCCDTGNVPNVNVQRRLAQWAVNVVDFRDADSIMTPFEYDPNPFDGWNSQCDGILNPGEPVNAVRGLVWGCERPELLLTETLAFHDRRTEDGSDEDPVDPDTMEPGTTTETMATKKDEDFDQRLRPQGSAFIELYNPWTGNEERQPAEFYRNFSNGAWSPGVRLDQRSSNGNSPVWRLLIVRGDYTRDPDDPVQSIPNADKERSVYFVEPTGINDQHGTAFFTNATPAPLKPGRYAIVGSADPPADPMNPPAEYATFIGFHSAYDFNVSPDAQDPMTVKNRQIVLRPNSNPEVNQFDVINNNDMAGNRLEPDYTSATQPIIAIPINQAMPSGMGMGATGRRFSISEPVDGYQSPATNPYNSAAAGGVGAYEPPIDKPLDSLTQEGRDFLMKNEHHPNFRTVHLQRLANPLEPWDPDRNPYLTIDSTGFDLTSFNGVDTGTEPDSDGPPEHFESLQRGDDRGMADAQRQLWRRTFVNDLGETVDTNNEQRFNLAMKHSLGFLNKSYGMALTANEMMPPRPGSGLLGDPAVTATDPTFPWLQWNNRPFNSVYELMEVPATSSSQLTRDYVIPTAITNPYTQSPNYQFGHLFNFYYAPATPPNDQVHSLYRIFDYLRVPSKFVESDTMLTATNFVNGTLAENPFHPPFNWLSNYRDPGMININTIYSKNVWNAVLGGDPAGMGAGYGLGPTFDDMVRSRRGYGSSGEILENNNAIPTEFAGAFRAAGTGDMNLSTVDPIEMTMLRKYPTTGVDTTKQNLPLFGNNHQNVHNNSARHPYFRHQTLQRLSNTLTTRSNVYACWVTIGYFEVDSSGQVGQELHADTGEIKRHRAFYMIDRSIPVGFEPGENHNVDRAILVRRYIE